MRIVLSIGFPFMAATALAGLLLGCGKNPEPVVEDGLGRSQLQDIWGLYQLYIEENKKPPTKLTDAEKYAIGFATGYDAVSAGDYVVEWGVHVGATASPNAVLAYPKSAPTQGGWVLMRDGNIRKMTADELKAIIKTK